MEDRSHKKSFGHMLLNTASVYSTNQTKFGKSITVFFIEIIGFLSILFAHVST